MYSKGDFDLFHLRRFISIFGDIYEWAGER